MVCWYYIGLAHLSGWHAYDANDDRALLLAIMFALCAVASAVKERK